jgi:isopenicillin-N epimerase
MLAPGVVHLNHGSFGAVPRVVFEAATAIRAKLEAAPMRYYVLHWQTELDWARAKVAAFVNAPAPRFAFVPSATAGVAIALASTPLAAGDRILVTNHGYNAVRMQVERLAAGRGLEIHTVPIELPFDADAFVDAVAKAITPRTRLAILDHITSPTALRLPLERLVPLFRGIPTLVDGAHAPGQIDLDVTAIGATYYTGNHHKWLCAPKSSGFLVAAEGAPIVPVVPSHAWGDNRMHAELDWSGTHDPAPHLVTPLAIDVVGAPDVRARNHALALEMRRRLCDALGARILAPDDAIGTMATIAITTPAPPYEIEKQLLREGWEVPVIGWVGGPFLRVSAHLYNDADEVDRLAAKLVALGVRGR